MQRDKHPRENLLQPTSRRRPVPPGQYTLIINERDAGTSHWRGLLKPQSDWPAGPRKWERSGILRASQAQERAGDEDEGYRVLPGVVSAAREWNIVATPMQHLSRVGQRLMRGCRDRSECPASTSSTCIRRCLAMCTGRVLAGVSLGCARARGGRLQVWIGAPARLVSTWLCTRPAFLFFMMSEGECGRAERGEVYVVVLSQKRGSDASVKLVIRGPDDEWGSSTHGYRTDHHHRQEQRDTSAVVQRTPSRPPTASGMHQRRGSWTNDSFSCRE